MKDDSSYAEAINQVHDNYLTSKKTVATIAGVNCLANLVGVARLEKRDVLTKQADIMPELLSSALEKLK